MSVAALLDKFERERLPLLAASTRRTYSISLAQCREFLAARPGSLRVDQMRPGHIKDFLNWRRTHSRRRSVASNRTLQKDRATLHAVFAFAEELELREGNPVGRVSVPKADPRDPVILTEEQYERLLAECTDRPMLSLYVLLLGETGARCESEALHLRWEDVDLEGGFLKITSGRDGHRTKSGKGRWVPMTPRLKQAMRDHFARFRFATYDANPTAWLFHHERRRRRALAGDRIRSLRSSFNGAAARAGLPRGLHQHDLRLRRVTTWLAEGGNPVHVKEAVGHSDLRTTMAYTHLAREHLQALVNTSSADSRARRRRQESNER
jgi:site-specific recombinase XerD